MTKIYPPGYRAAIHALRIVFVLPLLILGLLLLAKLILPAFTLSWQVTAVLCTLIAGPLYVAVFLSRKLKYVDEELELHRERAEIRWQGGMVQIAIGQTRRSLPRLLSLIPFSQVIEFKTSTGFLEVDERALARALGGAASRRQMLSRKVKR